LAVSLIRTTESHTGTTGSVSQASYTFAVGQAGDAPKGILVFTMQGVSATEVATNVTYGGQPLSKVTGGSAADTATEPGRVTAWFLGTSVPQGAPSGGVVVTRTNDTTTQYAVAFLLGGAADLEVKGTPVLQQENAAMTAVTIDDGLTSGASIVLAAGYSGDNTPAPAAATGMSTGHTLEGSYAYSFGAHYETTPTFGSRSRGCAATNDDRAQVVLAVGEAAQAQTYQIAGTVNAASGASGIVTSRLGIDFTQINAVSGASGAITKKVWVSIAGTAVVVSTTTANIVAKRVVSGAVGVVSGSTCAVTLVVQGVTYQIAGTANIVSGTSANITSGLGIAGTCACESGTQGTITAAYLVSGTIDAVSGASASVTVVGEVPAPVLKYWSGSAWIATHVA